MKTGLILIVLNMIHCSTQTMTNKVLLPLNATKLSANPEERYQEIRSRWTIRLSPARMPAGQRLGLPLPSRDAGAGGGLFPLTITATLMVDEVIDAGLLYYESMTGMTPQQADSFGQAYRNGNQVDQYMLIEISLQTSSAENYLDLKRYTIFIEDEQHNKYEATRIVQHAVSTQHLSMGMPKPDQKQAGYFDWTQHRKTIFLYFSRKDFYGKPIVDTDTNELKIVFILEEGGSGRVEGKWVFPDRQSSGKVK